MKKNMLKILIICIAVVLIILILVLAIIKNKKSNTGNQVNAIYSNEGNYENKELAENTPTKSTKEFEPYFGITKQVSNYAEYLDVRDCIENFNRNLTILYSNQNPIAMYEGGDNTYNTNAKAIEKIYNLIDQQYLDYYRVGKENFLRTIDYGVYKFNIDNLYKKVEEENQNIANYLVYGKLINILNNRVDDSIYIVRVDSIKKVYSIIPQNYINANRISEQNFAVQNNNIIENETNHIELNNFDKGKYAVALFENYKANLLYNRDKALNQLDPEYFKNRFQSAEEFYAYISSNENSIKISSLGNYNVVYKQDYTECTLYDKNDRCYIIKAKTPIDYTVMLDPYTIENEEYIESYNSADESRKVRIIVEKIENMINVNNDFYLYNKLNEKFKDNKCPSQEYFSQAIRKNIYPSNNFKILEGEKQGDSYIVQIEVQNSENASDEPKNITLIIKPKNNADFEFSFNVE